MQGHGPLRAQECSKTWHGIAEASQCALSVHLCQELRLGNTFPEVASPNHWQNNLTGLTSHIPQLQAHIFQHCSMLPSCFFFLSLVGELSRFSPHVWFEKAEEPLGGLRSPARLCETACLFNVLRILRASSSVCIVTSFCICQSQIRRRLPSEGHG